MGEDGTFDDTTPQPPPLKRRGGRLRGGSKTPSSLEEGVGGGVAPTRQSGDTAGVDRLRHRLYERAAKGRGNQTAPEQRLWNALRNRQLDGHKFRRQAVIGKRIVDFFCPAKGLVVEVDGVTHDREADARADRAMLCEHRFRTVRFTNEEVMRNLDGVLQALSIVLAEAPHRWPGGGDTTTRLPPQPIRHHPPTPSSKEEGEPVARNRKALSSSEEGVGGGVAPTVAQALREATARLNTDWARDEAEMLMAHALGVTRSAMLLGHMSAQAPDSFAQMVERRFADEPVAYIIGEIEFYGRRFTVTPDVLIPRGDSEAVLMAALEAAPAPRRILDCGTGSGILLLSLLAERGSAAGTGIERSPEALAVARQNADALGLRDRAELREADWTVAGWAAGLGQFDLVIANPPYVEDGAELDDSVRQFEPADALFAGPEGLDDYHVLIPQLLDLLTPVGIAVLEIGYRQADAVTAIAEAAGFTVELRRDLAGRDRALILRIKGLAKPR